MKDVSLGQLMRFGLAGGVYLGALVVGFVEPRVQLLGQTSGLFVGAATAVALVVGSILYSVHRAVLFPAIRRVLMSKMDKTMRPLDFDLQRWSLSVELGTRSLQSRLGVWADQIHFLYCAAWASVLALPTGWLFGWARLEGSWIIPVAAVYYNWEYQKYELAVIEADEALVAQLSSASSWRRKRYAAKRGARRAGEAQKR